MTVDDVVGFAQLLGKLSPLGAALVIVFVIGWVFYRKILVLGPYHTDLETRLERTEKQRDDALEMAAKLTDILEAGRRGNYRGR